jgi:serine/threonine-protein kinase
VAETLIAGRYRLDELLGQTGMSEVWAATDLELGRRVALKLLAPNADTARFEREARAVASLAHPNVNQLYDYGEEEGRPYMVLEYLPGGTLEDRLRDGEPLPDEDSWRISVELAAGLAHAHSRNVVHRDLKPANVLFDEEGRAKLADFGIARMAVGEGTLTEAGTVLGTATYISPEQAAGAPATAASDVYSFGVMLYRMLTGRLPFESSDPMELIALHRDAPVPPLTSFREDAPGILESTAAAALAKDPAGRPQNGAGLLTALGVPAGAVLTTTAAGFADPDATRVMPVAAPPPGQPPRRSRTPLAIVSLLVLGLTGGALAYELTRPASSSTPTETLPALSFPKPTTKKQTTQSVPAATAPATTAPSTSTEQTTTQQTTTHRTTTAPPPPTTTTVPPTTTAPPPTTTTAPPPTTTTAPTTTAAAP